MVLRLKESNTDMENTWMRIIQLRQEELEMFYESEQEKNQVEGMVHKSQVI